MTPPIPVARATLVGEIRPSEPNVMYAVVDTTEPQECDSDSFVDEPSEETTTRVGHMHTMEHTGTLRHLGRDVDAIISSAGDDSLASREA
eukprot:scaffold97890_cov55-Attheya_sp.AAC.3